MAMTTTIKNKIVHIGDIVRVYQLIREEEKLRTQAFEGIVIAMKGRDSGKSFTVRKVAAGGVGVERIWPVNSPSIDRLTVIKRGYAKKSKLYYLRNRVGKEAQVKSSQKGEQDHGEAKISGSQG